jgi:DNA-binding response OmpR family regulator
MVRTALTQARFDVELPLVEARVAQTELPQASRQLTVLIVEPDTKVQKQLVQLLGHRGDRVVPVSSAEEGGDLVLRVRFDMVICAVRLPGLNWVEFFERARHRVGGFVLLADGFDQESTRAFQGNDGLVLHKPLDEAEVQRICRTVEDRTLVAT